MSEIIVDELKGKTSTGDITVTSEGGAATQSLQQGLAKSWINFDGTSTGAVGDYARDSFNCAVTIDNGTGNFTIGFTSDMANANFSVSGCTGGNSTDPNTASGAFLCPQQTTSTFVIRTGSSSQDNDVDREFTFSSVHGDLA